MFHKRMFSWSPSGLCHPILASCLTQTLAQVGWLLIVLKNPTLVWESGNVRRRLYELLYLATSLLLVNTWVEKKWEGLSTKRRGPGGRDVYADLLPYPRFLAMLQYVLEREYEFILAVEVPDNKPISGSGRR